MIRINLIGRTKGKRRRGPAMGLPQVPNLGILLFALLFVIETAVFYSWHASAAEAADQVAQKVAKRKLEFEQLDQIKKQIATAKEETDKLVAQKVLFDELFADKAGPVNALSYLGFIVHPRDEATSDTEELKSLEAAGWRVGWDARKAWFTRITEQAGEVTLLGEALDHEDVAEVQRRLESSPYFRDMKLHFQEIKKDERLGVPYIEFTIRGSMVYLIVPVQPAAPPAEPAPGAAAAADAAKAGDTDAGKKSDAAPGKTALPSAALPSTPTPSDAPVRLVPVLPAAADAGASDADAGTGDADVDAGDAAAAPAEDAAAAPVVPKPVAAPVAPPARAAPPPLPTAAPSGAPPAVEDEAPASEF